MIDAGPGCGPEHRGSRSPVHARDGAPAPRTTGRPSKPLVVRAASSYRGAVSTDTGERAVPLPDSSLDLTWRPLTVDDVPAWYELERVIEAADELAEHYSAEDLHDELFDGSWKNPELDSLVGLDGDGEPRAFGLVDVRPGDTRVVRAFCWGGVHPQWRGRGIGAAVLTWQEARGRQKIAAAGKQAPGRLVVHSPDGLKDRATMLRQGGFSPVRWYIEMSRRLVGEGSEPIPDVELADGLRVVPFDRDLDEQVRLAHNEAFADHWGSEPRSAEDWQRATTGGRSFRPDWSFLVLADSGGATQVAGYTLASAYQQDWEAQGYTSGWTDLLGVRPKWRGRRLAPALLAASMNAMRDSGMQRAELGVDSENASGALGLYGGIGYTPIRREVAWAKQVED